MTTLGREVRRLRKEAGLGLREMARRTGVSAAFLSSVETGAGRGLPSEETIRRWAKVLGAHVNVDALICAAGRLPEDVVAWYCADPDRLRHVRARMERDEK